MRSEVFSKISLILPQDILLFIKYNGFQSKYSEISEQIIHEYKKGEHESLAKFLEKMDKDKNIK